MKQFYPSSTISPKELTAKGYLLASFPAAEEGPGQRKTAPVTWAETDRDSWEQPGDSLFGDSLKRGSHSGDGSEATPRLL